MRSLWGAFSGANIGLSHEVLRRDLGVVENGRCIHTSLRFMKRPHISFGVETPGLFRPVSATVEFGTEHINDAVIADVCRDCADRTPAHGRPQVLIIRSDLNLVSGHQIGERSSSA